MPSKVSDNHPGPIGDPGQTVSLSDAQFAKLIELLTPGYELAKIYLAQMRPPEANTAPAPETVRGGEESSETQEDVEAASETTG